MENVWPQSVKCLLLGPMQIKPVGSALRKINPLAALVLLQMDLDKDSGTEFGEFADRFKEAE